MWTSQPDTRDRHLQNFSRGSSTQALPQILTSSSTTSPGTTTTSLRIATTTTSTVADSINESALDAEQAWTSVSAGSTAQNTPQPPPDSPNRPTGVRAYFRKHRSSFTLLLGIVSFVIGTLYMVKPYNLGEWTAKKDYLSYCQGLVTSGQELSKDCASVVNTTLPPPPSRTRRDIVESGCDIKCKLMNAEFPDMILDVLKACASITIILWQPRWVRDFIPANVTSDYTISPDYLFSTLVWLATLVGFVFMFREPLIAEQEPLDEDSRLHVLAMFTALLVEGANWQTSANYISAVVIRWVVILWLFVKTSINCMHFYATVLFWWSWKTATFRAMA